jgi:hypothetical protein
MYLVFGKQRINNGRTSQAQRSIAQDRQLFGTGLQCLIEAIDQPFVTKRLP